MFISKNSAKKIVLEVKDVIHQEINMMDEKGYIIASTDPKREGQFHTAAQKIISQKLDQILVVHDDEYAGTKKGINLPILFSGEIIGVIGITGDVAEVAKYGRIIKRITEILLLDAYAKEQRNIQENLRADFLKQWIYGKFTETDQDFLLRSRLFGVDVFKPFRVLIAVAADPDELQGKNEIQMKLLDQKIQDDTGNFIKGQEGELSFFLDGGLVCLVSMRNDIQIKLLAEEICRRVKADFGLNLAVGIDSYNPDAKGISSSYFRAKKALQSAAACKTGKICLYSEIGLEIFMDDIPPEDRHDFIRQVFKGCTEGEIDEWVKILSAFFNAEGSINLAASRLFMHKNTLQYKLNKLSETTGHNPRKLSDAALFYLALRFLK